MPNFVPDESRCRWLPHLRDLHPWLIVATILTGTAARNVQWLSLADVLLLSFLGLLAVTVVYAVYFLARRNVGHAAMLTTASAMAACFYGDAFDYLSFGVSSTVLRHGLLIAGVLALHVLLWRIRSTPARLTTSISLGTAFVLVKAGMKLHTAFAREPVFMPEPLLSTAQTASVSSRQVDERPDIYYLVLDGYGRQDVMQRFYGFDNSEFLQALRERGFYVADKSTCNYSMTFYSLASSLGMHYHAPVDKRGGIRQFAEMVKTHQVGRIFQQHGYRLVHFNTNYVATDFSRIADVSLGNLSVFHAGAQMLMAALRKKTVLRFLDDDDRGAIAVQHRRVFEQLPTVPEMAGPKFTFVHLILPHPPYVFDQNGVERRDIDQAKRSAYVEQMIHTNHEVIRIIDIVRQKSRVPPVILIQGDHGPAFFSFKPFAQVENDSEFAQERIPILNAYLVPEVVRDRLYPTITPVNSFRVLLSECFGHDLPLLPDRNFIVHYRDWSNVNEVTDEVIDGTPTPDVLPPPAVK